MQPRRWIIHAVAVTLSVGVPEPGLAISFKVLHTFNSSMDGSLPHSAVILDETGNLCGTTVNGELYGTVFELSPHEDGTCDGATLYRFTSVSE